MAIADPQTVTITGPGTVSLPRTQPVNGPAGAGRFQSSDGTISFDFSNAYGSRTRRLARITYTKTIADPLTPANNVYRSMSFNIVCDIPPVGFTAAECKNVWDGFITQLNASSGAVVTKWLGGEV